MKAVISQTIFTAMATTHGPNHEILRRTMTPMAGRKPRATMRYA